jgi:hypothetical protein
LLLGEQAPEDRRMCVMAMDLIHATRTGQFPFAGPLRAQPQRLQSWYRAVLMMSVVAERIGPAAAMSGGMMGGGSADGDDLEGVGSSKVAPPPARRTRGRRIVGPSREGSG